MTPLLNNTPPANAAAAESHDSRQAPCATRRQPGNCFDYTFPGSQKEEGIPRLRAEGRRDQKEEESGGTSPPGQRLLTGAVETDGRPVEGGQGGRGGSHLCEEKQLGVIKSSLAAGTVQREDGAANTACSALPFISLMKTQMPREQLKWSTPLNIATAAK